MAWSLFGSSLHLSLGLGIPGLLGEHPTRHQRICWWVTGTCLSWCAGEQVSVVQRNLKKAWVPIESPAHQTG
jgi:hypothetical protein